MTAIVQGAEAGAVAIINTLNAHMPAALDTIYTAWNDTIPKNYPQQVYAMHQDLIDLGNFPCVVVTWLGSQQVANDATVWGEIEHRYQVSAGVVTDDRTTLERMALRHAWAIRQVLMTYPGLDGSLAGYGGGLDLGTSGRSKPWNGGTNFYQWAGWEVILHVLEAVN